MSAVPDDIAALAPWLEARIAGFGRVREVSKFGTGQSNPTFLVETDLGRWVLRAQPPGQLLKGAHLVDREYRVMRALAETGVPVPKAVLLSEEDSPLGRKFFVMGFVEGRIFWDPALPDLDAPARGRVYAAMNAALAALHDVRPEAVGLGDFGREGNYYARQLATWTRQYRASETETLADMDRLIDWLGAQMPADDGQSGLVHGDWRIDNMIFDPDSLEVRAILDWELSTLGHPYADLAYQCMQWRLPNDGVFKGLDGVDREALGLPTEREYVAAYCARRGLDGVAHWSFHIAFAFFRLAAILQGVFRRALDGNASNRETGLLYGRNVPLLARLAMEEIDRPITS